MSLHEWGYRLTCQPGAVDMTSISPWDEQAKLLCWQLYYAILMHDLTAIIKVVFVVTTGFFFVIIALLGTCTYLCIVAIRYVFFIFCTFAAPLTLPFTTFIQLALYPVVFFRMSASSTLRRRTTSTRTSSLASTWTRDWRWSAQTEPESPHCLNCSTER